MTVELTNLGEGLSGYLVNSDNEDVRKVLLKNGFAKLGKDSISAISTKEFMELKSIAQGALQEGKGLWKEQKVTKGETLNSKSYSGIVSEVHSGDNITVYNKEKQVFSRIYLPNIRAPTGAQPFAYEAKEALRRKVIGAHVRVEVEFSRKINVKKFEGDVGELKDFIFASVFDNNINIAVYLLESGLVSLQTPRVEEDVTKYFESLRDAEAKGKKDRRGIYSNNDAKPPNFNDLSGGKGKKIDPTKCKNIFPFIKDESHITGVIDLVLNGSRFKVRFNNQHVLAIMVLEGVRCLPNEGEFAKASEEALQFSKLHANQRDIEIELKSVDPKGIFHGKIYINKKDYALELLEKGLAFAMGGKFKNQKYDDAESLARKNKLGLWRYNLNLTGIKGETEKEYKPASVPTKTLILSEIVSANEFYLDVPNAKKPEVPQNPKPVTGSIEVGGLYAGQFSSDEQYYRARILKEVAGGKYHVQYIDYGNYETIPKASIGLLPENLKAAKSSLYKASLYGISGITGEGLNILKDYLNVEVKVEFKEQSEPQGKEEVDYRVILTEKNKESVNLELLQFGEAECSADVAEWRKAEEKAQQLREGKWANDDN